MLPSEAEGRDVLQQQRAVLRQPHAHVFQVRVCQEEQIVVVHLCVKQLANRGRAKGGPPSKTSLGEVLFPTLVFEVRVCQEEEIVVVDLPRQVISGNFKRNVSSVLNSIPQPKSSNAYFQHMSSRSVSVKTNRSL